MYHVWKQHWRPIGTQWKLNRITIDPWLQTDTTNVRKSNTTTTSDNDWQIRNAWIHQNMIAEYHTVDFEIFESIAHLRATCWPQHEPHSNLNNRTILVSRRHDRFSHPPRSRNTHAWKIKYWTLPCAGARQPKRQPKRGRWPKSSRRLPKSTPLVC